MDKPAVTDIPLTESIRKRWSPKIFSEIPVSIASDELLPTASFIANPLLSKIAKYA